MTGREDGPRPRRARGLAQSEPEPKSELQTRWAQVRQAPAWPWNWVLVAAGMSPVTGRRQAAEPVPPRGARRSLPFGS